MDKCPKCAGDLTLKNAVTIIQYLGVRPQHLAHLEPDTGCGWAWAEDPEAKALVDKWNERNYIGNKTRDS